MQRWQVVDVLEALAHRFQDDRKRRVIPGHIQQLLGALALLPQGRALAGVAARQQEGAGGALAEPGSEQGGVSHLLGDDVGDLVGVELEQGPGGFVVALGQAQNDAVVAGHGLGVHPGLLRDPPPGGQRPRGVHTLAERRVQHHAPVPELVGEALEHQRRLVWQHAGGLLLLLKVGPQIVARVRIERIIDARSASHLPPERAERLAEFVRAPDALPRPKRQPAGMPRRGRDLYLVARDVFDAPARRPEREHVADAGLVDHFLVELTDAARRPAFGLGADEEHAEHATVRDGAGVGDRDALRALQRLEHGAVEPGARLELREVSRGVHAGDQVDDGVEYIPVEVAVGPGAGDGLVPVIKLEVLNCYRGHRLLGEHVQRGAWRAQLLDEPVAHPRHGHGRLHQVGAVLRIERAVRDRAHRVPGAPDALQPGGDRRRRLHLDHQLHRPHIDAEFQRGRRHDRFERALFQHRFRRGPLIFGHAAVVRPRDHGRRLPREVDPFAQLCRGASSSGAERFGVVLLGPQLVELAGEPLRCASRVHEHDRRAVRHDLPVHRFRDVRPNRLRRRWHQRRGLPAEVQGVVDDGIPNCRRLLRHRQVTHISNWHPHREVPALLPRRLDDRRTRPEEVRHGLQRAHRRRQPDALKVPREAAEPLQRQCQVHAALRARERVNLVHDYGVHGPQDARGLRRQHQIQRLRRGDQDVRRLAHLAGPLRLRGVARAHRHRHVRHVYPHALRHAPNPAERGPQVIFDVHTKGLQRRDI